MEASNLECMRHRMSHGDFSTVHLISLGEHKVLRRNCHRSQRTGHHYILGMNRSRKPYVASQNVVLVNSHQRGHVNAVDKPIHEDVVYTQLIERHGNIGGLRDVSKEQSLAKVSDVLFVQIVRL